MLATARRHLVAGSGDYDGLGGRFEASRRLTPRVSASVRASWHDRRYRTTRDLDGPVLDLSLRGSWVATPTVRLDGSFGYGRERPAGRVRNRNTSRWVRVGAQAALPFGFSVGGSGQVRWTDFEGEGGWYPHTPAGEYREDRRRPMRPERPRKPNSERVAGGRDDGAQALACKDAADFRRRVGEQRAARGRYGPDAPRGDGMPGDAP